ncbi:MAG: sigma-70 family RNA polymerase sigma factor [Anaerolineae bacterium]
MTTSDDEKLWIARARQGDDGAFTQLVEAYQRPVFNLCYRMLGDPVEAEDAAQETFIRAYTRLGSYDPERKFSSWLLAIASHYCIDRLRRQRFGLVSWDDLPPWRWLSDPNPEPEEAALRKETQRQVRELLDRLPPDYKAAVILRYWHELSYEEIAQALDSTLPAIKSRLFRARQMMAQAATQAEATLTHSQSLLVNGVEALR